VQLPQRCRSLDVKWVLADHGALNCVSGADRSGTEGYTTYFACRRCGCRWAVFDWVQVGWVLVEQESPDGMYNSRGSYVDGKKHGRHVYARYRQGKECVDSLILSELWDHGRLVERKEYGPVVFDARGHHGQAVVRTWRAPKKKLPEPDENRKG
jgi:hypothetical protein